LLRSLELLGTRHLDRGREDPWTRGGASVLARRGHDRLRVRSPLHGPFRRPRRAEAADAPLRGADRRDGALPPGRLLEEAPDPAGPAGSRPQPPGGAVPAGLRTAAELPRLHAARGRAGAARGDRLLPGLPD